MKMNAEAAIISPMNSRRKYVRNRSSGNNELTVAGGLTNTPTSLSINGQGAGLYNDKTFAASGVGLNDGMNTFTAIMVTAGGSFTNSTTKTLPASVSLTYDGNGNLVSDGLKGYGYDCANESTSVTVTNNWRNEYVYDGFGRRRIAKNYVWYGGTWQEGAEKRYVYDGNNVIQERDGNNAVLVSYTRGTDLSGTMQDAGGIGGLLARTDVNGSAFYHADGNGNITMMIDSSGNQLAKYLYDSFGNAIGMWGTLASINTYRFSSKEIDTRSGLYYYDARYYDPNYQRWLNPDPIQELGGINLYQSVGNNTINAIDPDGRFIVIVAGVMFIAVYLDSVYAEASAQQHLIQTLSAAANSNIQTSGTLGTGWASGATAGIPSLAKDAAGATGLPEGGSISPLAPMECSGDVAVAWWLQLLDWWGENNSDNNNPGANGHWVTTTDYFWTFASNGSVIDTKSPNSPGQGWVLWYSKQHSYYTH